MILSAPFWPYYFVGLAFTILALSRLITRWLGPSVDERLRDTQQAIAESEAAAARIQQRANQHGPRFQDQGDNT